MVGCTWHASGLFQPQTLQFLKKSCFSVFASRVKGLWNKDTVGKTHKPHDLQLANILCWPLDIVQNSFLIWKLLLADFTLLGSLSWGQRATTLFAWQTNWKTFETDVIWTLEFFSHQSSLPTFTKGALPMELWWEIHSAHRVCASCRENTFLLPAWLKLDHQMASLHLSWHLIKIRCLWSILSRITALMWSGINIWFPHLSCVPLNFFFLHEDVWGRYRCIQEKKAMQTSEALLREGAPYLL